MALSQALGLKFHLALPDGAEVNKVYKKYQKYLLGGNDTRKRQNSQEEQYEKCFLNELFVNILGYTLLPNPNSSFLDFDNTN